MKIPELKNSKNPIRDAKILQLYASGKTCEEIAEWLVEHKQNHGSNKIPSVASLVQKIVYKHRAYLILDKNYENFKQTIRLRKRAENLPAKEAVPYESLLHEKVKADKTASSSGETRIVIIRSGTKEDKSETINVGSISVVRPQVVAALEASRESD